MAKVKPAHVLFGLGALLLVDKVFSLFSDPNDPAQRPYGDPGGPGPVWSDAQLRAYADELEAAFWSAFGEDEPTIIARLSLVPTDRDMVNLINTYGQRGSLLGFDDLTLPASVARWLSASQIARINAALSLRGLKFRF